MFLVFHLFVCKLRCDGGGDEDGDGDGDNDLILVACLNHPTIASS